MILLIGSHWFQPWYAIWAIALVALIPSRRVACYTLIFSFSMLLHPIALQYGAVRLKLPPGGFHALMARHIARPTDPGHAPGFPPTGHPE